MDFTLSTKANERLDFTHIRVLTTLFLDDDLGWGIDDLGSGNPPLQPCDLIFASIYMNDDGDPGFSYATPDSSNKYDGPEFTGSDLVHLHRIKAILIPAIGDCLPDIPPVIPFDQEWKDKVETEILRVAEEKGMLNMLFEWYNDDDLIDIDLSVQDIRHVVGYIDDYLLFIHVKEGELDIEWVSEIKPAFIVSDPYFKKSTEVYSGLDEFEFNDSVYDVANDVSHDDITAVVYKTTIGGLNNA